jgi:hypothetical protein
MEHAELYEEVKKVLGVDKLTKPLLIEQLRFRNERVSGNKDVLARRLLSFENDPANTAAGPPQWPLAISFITDDSQ